ncbi:MAG: histidinol-phosphate transaminase [Polyangiaceae bacterium]
MTDVEPRKWRERLLRPGLEELTAYAPHVPGGIEVRLDANEAPPASSEAIAEAVSKAISRVSLERYPDAGASQLKAAIAARTGASPGDLMLGSGSDEIISLLFTGLARCQEKQPQPVVLTPTPTFVMYRTTARGHGWKPVEVPLDGEWDLDVTMMKRAIDVVQPNLVFIASPNNPTGNAMTASRLEEVIAHATNALVVVDEAYVDYASASVRGWRARFPNLGILRTLSKIGLAALRVGWVEADAGLIAEVEKVRQPFNLSATSQAAAAAVLHEAWEAVVAQTKSVTLERERVASELGALGSFEVTPSQANFLWIKTARPAEEIFDALVKRGILVRSFHKVGGRLARQLRVTIGLPQENDRLLEGLRACGA